MKVYAARKRVNGDLTITGNLVHTGGSVGIYNVTPVGQAGAVGALTDNSGGVADGTVATLGTVGVDVILAASQGDVNARLVTINNNMADLATKITALTNAVKNVGVTL